MNPAPTYDTGSQGGKARINEHKGEPTITSITAAQARQLTGDTWLTRQAAAEFLGLSEQTLANNRRTGPKFHKLFGTVRYRLADLVQWTRQRAVA